MMISLNVMWEMEDAFLNVPVAQPGLDEPDDRHLHVKLKEPNLQLC